MFDSLCRSGSFQLGTSQKNNFPFNSIPPGLAILTFCLQVRWHVDPLGGVGRISVRQTLHIRTPIKSGVAPIRPKIIGDFHVKGDLQSWAKKWILGLESLTSRSVETQPGLSI